MDFISVTKKVMERTEECVPVPSVTVWAKTDHANSRAFRTVFTHKAVGVRPVREVFGHQGNCDRHLLYVLNGTLNLKEVEGEEEKRKKRREKGRRKKKKKRKEDKEQE